MNLFASKLVKQVMDEQTHQAIMILEENAPAIERVESWLADEASRESYRRELAFMLLGNLTPQVEVAVRHAGSISFNNWEQIKEGIRGMMKAGDLPAMEYPHPTPDWAIPDMFASTYVMEQYRYGDTVRIKQGDVFLDCGACGGETAIWAIGQGAGKVYSFEPNPVMHSFIRKNTSRHCAPGAVEVITQALDENPGILNLRQGFSSVGEAHLHTGDEGEPVPVTTLDHWCRNRKVTPDFIKMDLEGYEVPALRGARETISQHRPKLAICLYHKLSDMWEIPALVKEFHPGYQLYCRKNAPVTEFVLYADPA